MSAAAAASPWVLGARSETGYVRAANEDRMGWTRTPFGDVFVVSDGMGGHRGGALAAEITVQTLQQELATIAPGSEHFSDQIRQAFAAANREVHLRRQTDDPATREMGATAVSLVTDGARFIVAHVGDSRAYLWRRGRGLRRLTHDHSRVQTMMDAGLLTPEQAAVHPEQSVLERAIGHHETVQVDVTDWITLKSGDMVLLCSDGLCGYVEDAQIAAILDSGDGPQALTDRLIDCALGTGGHDNVTVQLVRYAPPARRFLGSALSRPVVLAPACIGLTAIGATLVGLQMSRGYEERIGELDARLSAAQQALKAVPPATPSSGLMQAPAASPPAVALPASVGAKPAASAPAKPATRPTSPKTPRAAAVPRQPPTKAEKASSVASAPSSGASTAPAPGALPAAASSPAVPSASDGNGTAASPAGSAPAATGAP